MRILIVARGYSKDENGHCGIFEFDQAKALARLGHEVYVIAIDIRSIRHLRQFGMFELERNDVKIFYASYPCGGLCLKIREVISRRILQSIYSKIVKKYGEPAVIHAHFIDNAYYTIKSLAQIEVPIVVTEHSSKINVEPLDKMTLKMGLFVYERVDNLICVSSRLGKRIEDIFDVKSIIIPNIVDTSIFEFVERRKNKSQFTFVTVANLIPLKRIKFLVGVFSEIAVLYSNVRLIIIGDGEEKSGIKRLIEKHQIENKVYMTGAITRERIKTYFEDSDCFVLPSSSETFGVVYIEAMATGLPVIATKCGGPEDFVNIDNGILIEIDNEIELFDAMKKMITSIDNYNSKSIAKNIKTKFSEESIALQIDEVYKNLGGL